RSLVRARARSLHRADSSLKREVAGESVARRTGSTATRGQGLEMAAGQQIFRSRGVARSTATGARGSCEPVTQVTGRCESGGRTKKAHTFVGTHNRSLRRRG